MKFTGRIKDIGRTLSGALTITLESQGGDSAAAMDLAQEGESFAKNMDSWSLWHQNCTTCQMYRYIVIQTPGLIWS